MSKGFDPKCRELAEHFMAGDIELGAGFDTDALAQEIQNAVEGWFEYRVAAFTRRPTGTWDSPPFTFARADSLRAPTPLGQWRPIAKHGGHTAMVACPTCGFESLLTNHSISPDGRVVENVQCPRDPAHHYHATLDGWNEFAQNSNVEKP